MGDARAPRSDRDPKPMRDLLRTLVAGRGWSERLAIGRLREAWPEVVGPQIAARSEPTRLARGTLTVAAEAGAWASELALLAPMVARKAGAFLGGATPVREVKVTAVGSLSRGAPGGG